MVLADITGNGRINASDASHVARFAALIPISEIPPIPSGVIISPTHLGTAAKRSSLTTVARVDAFADSDTVPSAVPVRPAVDQPLNTEPVRPQSLVLRNAGERDAVFAGRGTTEDRVWLNADGGQFSDHDQQLRSRGGIGFDYFYGDDDLEEFLRDIVSWNAAWLRSPSLLLDS
jgi:hypothetical protein